jgi:putative flippase GtrA
MPLSRQISAFVIVGLFAVIAHYGALIALVEIFQWDAVPATLVGYVCGGVTSYILNRRHTFESARRHREAIWRFAAVAGIGFVMTGGLMTIFVEKNQIPYLLAQIITTGIVQFWSFLGNKLWTFGKA